MSIAGTDVESLSSSTVGSASGTPRNRVKFLCSHGGKILPRPTDAHLKYVGGETRVICVPRDVTFPELMKKVGSMLDGEMAWTLKYQLMGEDLDVLVTVKSDEDVGHMIEECDRYEVLGSSRLRAFLFSANPINVNVNVNVSEQQSVEQRYINCLNGLRTPADTVTRNYSSPNLWCNVNQSPKPPHPLKSCGPRTRSTDGHSPRIINRGGGHMRDDYYGSCRYDSPPGSPLIRSPRVLSPTPTPTPTGR